MKNFIKENWIKILAIIILLCAVFDNPYGYYQFLRWSIMIIGGYLAYLSYISKKNNWTFIFIAITVLFNPIIPFYFSKDVWQILDIVTAVIFSYSLINNKNK